MVEMSLVMSETIVIRTAVKVLCVARVGKGQVKWDYWSWKAS